MELNEAKSGRTTAIAAHITIVGCLIAMTMNMEPKNAFARFHIRQAFGCHLLYHAFAIFFNYSDINAGWTVLYIVYLAAIVFGLWASISLKKAKLPLVGTYFQNWFKFIP
ncbi:MAG: hypothetical protein AAFU57_16040 [Bacteroidota bacterium]